MNKTKNLENKIEKKNLTVPKKIILKNKKNVLNGKGPAVLAKFAASALPQLLQTGSEFFKEYKSQQDLKKKSSGQCPCCKRIFN